MEALENPLNTLLQNPGILSENELNHQRNLAITSVTLSTRAAIDGGVSPAVAYRTSDIYINKIDQCLDPTQLEEYSRKNMYDFARLVARAQKEKAKSSYSELCKEYIHNHYHQKFTIGDIADAVGLSESYLSRIFYKETGVHISEYINRFRVKRAENLLKYSEASLSEISDYVCFYSQSHFGSVFKKYNNMTPKQYRDKYKNEEFRSE